MGGTTESALPYAVAQNNDGFTAFLFVGGEQAPENRFDAQYREEICRDARGSHAFWASLLPKRKVCPMKDVMSSNVWLRVFQSAKLRRETRPSWILWAASADQSMARRAGSLLGKRAEQDGVDHAEDGGVCADAEG